MSDPDNPFDFNSAILTSGKFGKIIEASSDEIDLVIIFSDGPQEKYGLVSMVFENHKNSCKLGIYSRSQDKYFFDFSGNIYLSPQGSGHEIELDVTGTYGSISESFVFNQSFVETTFEGITARDEQGVPLSNEDPEDWKLIVEPSLLERTVMNISGPVLSDKNYDTQFYPNPANQIGYIRNIIGDSYLCDYVLVTPNYGVLLKIDSVSSNSLAGNFYHTDQAGELSRLYYKIYNDSNTYLGYGDIIINK